MKRKVMSRAPVRTPRTSRANLTVTTRRRANSPHPRALIEADDHRLQPASSGAAGIRDAGEPKPFVSFKAKLGAALGCKTFEMAFALLDQIIEIEHPNKTMEQECMNTLQMKAIATLAELEPATATEAMLAAQMVGAQRLAMTYLARATAEGQTSDGIDRNVLRATRLMRLFNEQVETMSKLKGKSGQQRVVVEHVTVAAGGQAIVGAVMSRGRGAGGDEEG